MKDQKNKMRLMIIMLDYRNNNYCFLLCSQVMQLYSFFQVELFLKRLSPYTNRQVNTGE